MSNGVQRFPIFTERSKSKVQKQNPSSIEELGFKSFPDSENPFEIPDDFDETYSQASSEYSNEGIQSPRESKDPRKRVPEGSCGEAEMRGKRIVFPEIFDEFNPNNLDGIRQKEPPYVPKLNDNEMSQLVKYIIQKNNDKQIIQEDPYYLFVQLVAGASNTTPQTFINSMTNRGSFGGSGRAITSSGSEGPLTQKDSPEKVMTTALSSPFSVSRAQTFSRASEDEPTAPSQRIVFESPIEEDPVVRRQTEDQPPPAPRHIPMHPPEQIPKRGLTDDTLIRLMRDPLWKPFIEDYLSRTRQFDNLPWLERSETLGIMDLSPILYSNMLRAHQEILLNNRDFNDKGVTIDNLIQDQNMRIHYADVTSSLIAITKTMHPTRPSLDKAERRAYTRKGATLKLISQFQFDGSGRFIRVGYKNRFHNRTHTIRDDLGLGSITLNNLGYF